MSSSFYKGPKLRKKGPDCNDLFGIVRFFRIFTTDKPSGVPDRESGGLAGKTRKNPLTTTAMEDKGKKTLEERKEGFKTAANQTVPVMGLEPEKPAAEPESDFIERGCGEPCRTTCVTGCRGECKDTCRGTCKDQCGNNSKFVDHPEDA